MHCLAKITFVLSIMFILDVSGNLIRSDVITKDVTVPKNEDNEIEATNVGDSAAVDKVAVENVEEVAVDPVDEVAVDPTDEVAGDDKTKPCTAIGQFCINHSECCSNACLGYMRRCVSGSG